ncbi:bifunctional tRNA (adenosine(37)-N6)-threonylcarbamoyltransferase complex ATPase subunit type 1 TsaE/phosphotransferase [Aureimonas endophytica]|uniref:tRNA threonylcarbamoyladenosine biosynthesis protein TsaE n=1 Tax=Aureimonas endophytica TaxID=2027858 RepID=A0A916ZV60_9HYPH|nr:tRNA (adenosine(37)-N6)-threonylcarbamoyltransferase complex ATPase subunit type 1 TsaE [Aureimonas endophytica]GGE15599.1 bifunctional tRNA (adenosine(37)-N6)-threonylcarbamoyltransferase complex ATPase subunit type 1 TsaE/phosphotransferase [Aureimonas endophytica]
MNAPARFADRTATRDLFLADDAATERFGEDLAMILKRGDLVALTGDLGAGKSTLARAAIRALAGDPALEVPSPTYTLVQTYATNPPLAHLDLYRLGDASEIEELGLEDAAETGIVLCEWPERAPEILARAALRIELAAEGAGRRALVSGQPEAVERLARSLDLRAFLDRLDPPAGTRRRLFGDASSRRYETAEQGGRPLIVMDAPKRPNGPPIRDGLPYSRLAHLAEDVVPFVAVDRLLRELGFAAPEIVGEDIEAGFLALEHLGSETLLSPEGAPLPERYEATARALALLHAAPIAAEIRLGGGRVHRIPPFDRTAMGIEVEQLLDWYLPDRFGRPASPAERHAFLALWDGLVTRLEAAERSIVLRDVHSPNVIWREGREGVARIGLIDFQDAMIGPSAYDLASLAQDARVDIAPELEAWLVAAYVDERRAGDPGFDAAGFAEAYAIMAAQRATKILGIFVRLEKRDGKPFYRRHIPRLQAYLQRTVEHPSLHGLRDLYRDWGVLAPSARKG